MLKILAALLTVLLLCSSCSSTNRYVSENFSQEQDAALHVGIGAIGYTACYYLLPKELDEWKKVVGCSVAVLAILGIEELTNKNPDGNDFATYAIGVGAAAGTFTIMEW